MLLNYLKLSLRLFLRDPFFTLIKVFGLAVGFTVFFILWPYATSQLKTDKFHKDFDRIVRLGLHMQFPIRGSWGDIRFGGTRPYHIPLMAADLREVEAYTRFLAQPKFNDELVGHGNKVIVSVFDKEGGKALFKEEKVIYADSNFFGFFSIPLVRGAVGNVLGKPNSVAISQSKATSYFGKEDPIGQLLVLNDSAALLTVTAVFQDLPDNTHLNFDVVISNVGVVHNWYGLYGWPLAACYMKMDKSTGIREFEEAINANKEKYLAEDYVVRPAVKYDFFVQPLEEVSFGPVYTYDFFFKKKAKLNLLLLQAVSVVILVMAWANYVNLTLSTMRKRMKEIATRKVSGANVYNFLQQFVVESCVLNLLAVALSLTFIQLLRNPAEYFLGIRTTGFELGAHATWYLFLLVTVAGILVTGIYPALMSRVHNASHLYSYSRGVERARSLTVLTTAQYIAALALVIWVFMVSLQLDFILHKNLGFDRERVVIVEAPYSRSDTYQADFDAFMNTVSSSTGVLGATGSYRVVTDRNVELITVIRAGGRGDSQMDFLGPVDEKYIPFYRIPIVAGRNFRAGEKNALILSRYAAQRLGFKSPENAIGEKVNVDRGEEVLEVVGVVENYRVNSFLHLVETDSENDTGRGVVIASVGVIPELEPEKVSIRLSQTEVDQTMATIKDQFNRSFPGNVFDWYFLDDRINAAYGSEQNARNQIALFTGLAIFVSCLGFLGMMTTLVMEKTKEIGIRKALGAELYQIGILLLKRSSKEILIAIIIGIPVAYYLVQQYLERFLERITLQWWHFALPVALLIVILFATIASMIWKAANRNPVEALKYE